MERCRKTNAQIYLCNFIFFQFLIICNTWWPVVAWTKEELADRWQWSALGQQGQQKQNEVESRQTQNLPQQQHSWPLNMRRYANAAYSTTSAHQPMTAMQHQQSIQIVPWQFSKTKAQAQQQFMQFALPLYTSSGTSGSKSTTNNNIQAIVRPAIPNNNARKKQAATATTSENKNNESSSRAKASNLPNAEEIQQQQNQLQWTVQTSPITAGFFNVAQNPDINHQSSNMERYMPLLVNRKLTRTASHATPIVPSSTTSKPVSVVASAVDSASSNRSSMESEWSPPDGADEDEDQDQQGLEEPEPQRGRGGGQQPCVTAACRTWVMITIPEAGAVIQWPTLPFIQQRPESSAQRPPPITPGETTEERPSSSSSSLIHSSRIKPITGSWTSTNRTLQIARQKPPLSTTTTQLPPTTTDSVFPQGNLIFSTKWIIPINPSSRQNFTVAPSFVETTTPSIISSPTTTVDETPLPPLPLTTSTAGPVDIGGGGEEETATLIPFTLRPVPNVAPVVDSQATLFPKEKEGRKRLKPWTHSAGPGHPERPQPSGKTPKRRPPPPPTEPYPPPTPETTIEAAAIWASTELIDAIREALEKFRASLTRSSAIASDEGVRTKIAKDVNDQLQTTWNAVKKAFPPSLSQMAFSDAMKQLLGQSLDDSVKVGLDSVVANDSPSKPPSIYKRRPVKGLNNLKKGSKNHKRNFSPLTGHPRN